MTDRFIVYHKPTTLFLTTWLARNKKPYRFIHTDTFETPGAANAALTRAVKKVGINRDDFAVLPAQLFYSTIEKKEVRKGIVHSAGHDFEVGVNTPWTSGPWSETYWCS